MTAGKLHVLCVGGFCARGVCKQCVCCVMIFKVMISEFDICLDFVRATSRAHFCAFRMS